jgi:hypothetical protein
MVILNLFVIFARLKGYKLKILNMRRVALFSAFFILTIASFAGQIDRNTAFNVAKEFFANKGIEMKQNHAAYKAPRVKTATDNAYYYVFNAGNDKGFVVVSGDDRTPQILGYTDSGTFIEDEMPENMLSWLSHYADEIKYMDENNIQRSESAQGKGMKKASKAHHSIAPMLTCLWDQGDPYNYSCPDYYNKDGSTGRSATGCVATAIAQVLYYHKYPAATKKRIPAHINRYPLDDGTTKSVTLRPIAAGTKIDWDNMLDRYNGSETEEQKKAVGDLMLLVGQSVKMGYGASSGSSYANSRQLFVDYLGYDDGVQILRSDKYGIQEWFEMMYDELAAGYPIAYGGSSTGGGHAFVVDGFDGDKLFHLNWGWSGGSNGYFLITVLNPGDQGIGGSTSADGFSMAQDAIMYLRSEDDGIPFNEESDTHMSINDTQINGSVIKSNYINWTGSTNSFNGAIVMADETGELVPVSNIQTTANLSANHYISWSFDLKGKFSEPGSYKITPASKLTTNSIWRPLYNFKDEYILAVVDDALNVTLTYVKSPIKLEVTDWYFPGTLVKGEQQNVTVTFKNNGEEFLKEVGLYASKTNEMGVSVSRALVGVKAGETNVITFYFKPEESGTYNLWLTPNGDPNTIIGKTTVEITDMNANRSYLRFNTLNVSNRGVGGRAVGTVNIQNKGNSAFKGKVKLQVWVKALDSNLFWSSSSTQVELNLEPGSSTSAEFDFQNLELNRTYIMCAYYTNQKGELENGGLIYDHSFTTKSGITYWNNYGSVLGMEQTDNFRLTPTTSGALIDGQFSTITPSRNTNAIIAVTDRTKLPSGLDGCNVVVANKSDKIDLVSNLTYAVPVNFTAAKAAYSHTFDVACDGIKGYNVITLPFTPSSITIDGAEVTLNSEGGIIMKEFTEENDNNEVVFADAVQLRGSTPYIIGAPEQLVGKTVVFSADNAEFKSVDRDKMIVGSEHYLFHGTSFTPRVNDCYVMNADGSGFEYVPTTTRKVAQGGYFTTELSEVARPSTIKIYGPVASGISDVREEAQSSDVIYDIQGRHVTKPTKGIYIKNGKKYIIK